MSLKKNTLYPVDGAVWYDEDGRRLAKVQIPLKYNLPDLKWVAFDNNGKDISDKVKTDYKGVDVHKPGSYDVIVTAGVMFTSTVIEVLPKGIKPARLIVEGYDPLSPEMVVDTGFKPLSVASAIGLDGKKSKVKILPDGVDTLPDGKHEITWVNTGFTEQRKTATVMVGDCKKDNIPGTTDGMGSFGNPPSADSYVRRSIPRTTTPAEIPEELSFLIPYEDKMKQDKDLSAQDYEEWQMHLYRYIIRILNESAGAELFEKLLDRAASLPEVYSELKLTRYIGDMIPHLVPEWYFRFLWLISKAAPKSTRASVAKNTNFVSLLKGMPSNELEFVIQFFANLTK